MSDTLRDRIVTAILNAVYDPLCTSAARSAADAILAIPGVAVVELPEPHRAPPMPFWNGGEIRTDGRLVVMGDYSLTVSSARGIAADLLAAADYAERD